jgi:hypothetical protein
LENALIRPQECRIGRSIQEASDVSRSGSSTVKPVAKNSRYTGPLQQTTRNAKTNCPLNHVQDLSDLMLICLTRLIPIGSEPRSSR